MPVRRGAGLVGLHQRAQHHARFSPVTFFDRNEPARPQVGLVGATRTRREFRVLSPALGAGYRTVQPSWWLRARPTAECMVTRCERPKHESALDIPARACGASAACLPRHPPCEPLPTSYPRSPAPARRHTGQHAGRPLPALSRCWKKPRNQAQHAGMSDRAQSAAHRTGTDAPGPGDQRQQNAGSTERKL